MSGAGWGGVPAHYTRRLSVALSVTFYYCITKSGRLIFRLPGSATRVLRPPVSLLDGQTSPGEDGSEPCPYHAENLPTRHPWIWALTMLDDRGTLPAWRAITHTDD